MAKNEGAVIETEELEVTEPEESQEGAYAEVGEGYDDSEPTDVEENQEPTEPDEESDETHATEEPEEQPEEVEEETADVPQGKKSADSAFAEMRRANEELQTENEELKERIAELERGNKQSELIRTATEMGLSEEEIQQVLEDAEAEEQAEREKGAMQSELDELRERAMTLEAEKRMREDLQKIQAIDPSIKSMDDLPDEFFNYISAGMDGEDAYWATQARSAKEKYKGAKELGKANSAPIDRDYYTSEELDNLSDAEMDANWDKVQRSLTRLSK